MEFNYRKMMDIPSVVSESLHSLSSENVFAVLNDFIEACKVAEIELLGESFVVQSHLFFEFLENTLETYSHLFFETKNSSLSSYSLSEYSTLKLIEAHQYLSDETLKIKTLKILQSTIRMCKTMSTPHYDLIIEHILKLYSIIHQCYLKKQSNFRIAQYSDFYIKTEHSLINTIQLLITLICKIASRDRHFFTKYIKTFWLLIHSSFTYILSLKPCLKLLALYLLASQYPSNSIVSSVSESLLSLISSPYKNQIETFFSHLNAKNLHKSFIIGIANYFCRRNENFIQINITEYHLIRVLYASNFNILDNSILIKLAKKLNKSNNIIHLIQYHPNETQLITKDPWEAIASIIPTPNEPNATISEIIRNLSHISHDFQIISIIKMIYFSIISNNLKLLDDDRITLSQILKPICLHPPTDIFDKFSLFYCLPISDIEPSIIETFLITSFDILTYSIETTHFISSYDRLTTDSKIKLSKSLLEYYFSYRDPFILRLVSQMIQIICDTPPIETLLLSFTDDIFYILLSEFECFELSDKLIDRIFHFSLMDSSTEAFDNFFKTISHRTLMLKHEQRLTEFLFMLVNLDISPYKLFAHQHRFVIIICKVLENFHDITRVFEATLSKIIECSLTFSRFIFPLFRSTLQSTLDHRQIRFMDLYHTNQSVFHTPFLRRLLSMDVKDCPNFISNINMLLDESDSSSFVSYLLIEVIKNSILNCCEPLLKSISQICNLDVRSLIVNNAKYIFPYLFANTSFEQLESSMKFIETLANDSISHIIRGDYQSILHHSFLYLSQNENRVLAYILSFVDGKSLSKQCTYAKGSLEKFFNSELLGVLAFFNLLLVSGDISYKKLVIKCVSKLILNAGRRSVDYFRFKILSILKFATELSLKFNLTKDMLVSWSAFTNTISDHQLAPLASQIIPSVLSLSPFDEDKVYEVLQIILIEQSRITHQFLHEVHLFNFKPTFQPISNVLVSFWKKYTQSFDFPLILANFCQHIESDQSDIRRSAIINFSDFMISRYYASDISIIETANKPIQNIYIQLLRCCSDPRSDCLFEAGRCLGILGCLYFNPNSEITTKPTNLIRITMSVDYSGKIDDFGINLLKELAHTFLNATETIHQDCAAFAIQEVMKVYDFLRNQTIYFEMFPPNIKEALIPHLTSSYSSTRSTLKTDPSQPIFSSPNATTYSDWIRLWCATLIVSIPKGSFRASLLKPCFAIARLSVPIAKLLLPYAIVTIIDSSSSISCISIEIDHLTKLVENACNVSDHTIKAVENIFELFDFLCEHNKVEKSRASQILAQYLSQLCKKKLSVASFACRLFTRSLRYLETYINSHDNKEAALIENMDLMKKIYFNLQDYDAIVGVNRVSPANQTDSTIVLQMESEGRFMEAIACHEKNLPSNSSDFLSQLGIMKCYLNLGQFQSVISYYNSFKVSPHDSVSCIYSEALWRLGCWNELNDFMQNSNPKCCIANTLRYLQEGDLGSFQNTLVSAYKTEASALSLHGNEPRLMKSSFISLAKLHLLFDIELYYRTFNEGLNIYNLPQDVCSVNGYIQKSEPTDSCANLNFAKFMNLTKNRLNLTELEFNIREPIINLHRILFNLKSTSESKPNYWVDIANVARKCSYHQTAFNYLLCAAKDSANDWCYLHEMAKFLITNRSPYEALAFLRKHLSNAPVNPEGNSLIMTKLQLMMCQLMSDTSDCDPSEIIKSFNDLLRMNQNLEKVHFSIGNYLHKLYQLKNDSIKNPTPSNNPSVNVELNIIQHYGSSLKFGYRYLYHSLPRLITLWLDYPNALDSRSSSDKIKQIEKMCEKVKLFCNLLQPFVFLCVLSQLVSRICHPNNSVWNVLSSILIKLLSTYPHQVSWQMIGIAHSTFTQRVKRCKYIFDAVGKDANIANIINNLMMLTSNLLEISNRKETSDHIKLSESFASLRSLIDNRRLANIIVPILNTLTCYVPSSPNTHNHSLFVNPALFISNINDRIAVLPSLIRPKRIEVTATDGNKYNLLCKPKDDLRRDSRLMEFNSLVNKLLYKNPGARRRNLKIHLYAVIVLNDECGIIEWVNNTVSYRSIMIKLYNEVKGTIPLAEIKAIFLGTNKNPDELLKVFSTKILPAFPAVFYRFFDQKFSDASTWYFARQSYMRSAAVMSMVGYILGLGDRHGDNILFTTTGEVVHVDFNCLFNKGDSFEWPEKVPFRLTHNMLAAMGPLGLESCFRTCCEITLDVMRSRLDSLLCVLSTFLHDPLVEWVKQKKGLATGPVEQANQMAVKTLQQVEKRLLGITPPSNFLVPLSVQGQVHQLIQEATSITNLSRMYFGWASYY